jgi:uncharacterized membrane protein YfcA
MGAFFAASIPAIGLGGAFGIFMVVMGIVIWRKGLSHESLSKAMKKVVKFETRTQKIVTALILGLIVGLVRAPSPRVIYFWPYTCICNN